MVDKSNVPKFSDNQIAEMKAIIEQNERQKVAIEAGRKYEIITELNPGQKQMCADVVEEQKQPKQVDWKQPEPTELAEKIKKWFKDYAENATHEMMSDDEFKEQLKYTISLNADSHLDESFRKLAAMHTFPRLVVSKEEPDFNKECAYFVKHIIKPTEQRSVLLGRLAHKTELSFNRDHPDVKLMTERVAALCIQIHGKDKVVTHFDTFASKVVGFCDEFTKESPSMPSKWNVAAFRDLNPVLRLASGCGDVCPKGDG